MQALHAQSRRFWYTYEPTESFAQGAKLHGAGEKAYGSPG
jgi:hypothetical protein